MKKIYAFIGSMLLSAAAFGATFNLFTPATGVLKGNASTYVTTAAASTDIYGLWTGTCSNTTYLRGDGICATPPGAGGGTVNSVGLSAPSVFSVAGSPVTNTGTLALTFAGGQTANQFLASPDGTTGAITLRSMVAADVPSLNLTSKITTTLTGLLKGTGSGAPSAYTGTSCTNQFPRSLDVSGAATCASVSMTADVTGITPAANGGTANGFTAFSGPATSTKTFTLPNASATVLTDNATITVAQGGTGVATLTGIAKGNGTSAFTAAASSDVISTWGGTCSASTYLRGDGSCQTPPTGGTSANPSATIGLTAVNGAAGTFLRSDGAPALSQSIVPTWTGVHTFTSAGTAISVTNDVTAGTFTGNGAALTALNAGNVSSGILAAANGGTANGFTAFTGPTTSTKTFTLPNASATVLTTNAAVTVAQGGTGAATLTGYVKGSGTSAMTASATIPYSDLTGTPTVPTAANPTGTIGLTAVNGSAGTFLRSDGAPALSQSIVPTWTGNHNFAATGGSPVTITGAAATINRSLSLEGTTTAANYIRATNTGGGWFLGVDNSAGNALITGGSAYGTVLTSTTATDISLATNTAERIRVGSVGNVTVNTPSSGTPLTVSGGTLSTGLTVTSSAGSLADIKLQQTGQTAIDIYNAASTSDLYFGVGAATRFVMGSSGQLGIGGATYGTAGQVLTSQGSSAAPTWTSPSAAILSGGTISSDGAGGCALVTNATIGLSSCSAGTTSITVTFTNAAAHFWTCAATMESASAPYTITTGRTNTTTSVIRVWNLTSVSPITWTAVNTATTSVGVVINCQPI